MSLLCLPPPVCSHQRGISFVCLAHTILIPPPSNICTCFLSLKEKIILALRHIPSLLKEDIFSFSFRSYISNSGQRRFITSLFCHIWAPVFWKGKCSPSFPLPHLVASRSTSLLYSWLWLCQHCSSMLCAGMGPDGRLWRQGIKLALLWIHLLRILLWQSHENNK